jgi:hypothetical protein
MFEPTVQRLKNNASNNWAGERDIFEATKLRCKTAHEAEEMKLREFRDCGQIDLAVPADTQVRRERYREGARLWNLLMRWIRFDVVSRRASRDLASAPHRYLSVERND